MKLTRWDIQDYLTSVDDIRNYLVAALAENNAAYLKIAVKDCIKALKRLGKKNGNIG